MKWKLPDTYHDYMKSFKELVWPKKVEKVEKPKEKVKVSGADE